MFFWTVYSSKNPEKNTVWTFTGVMASQKFSFAITGINYILKYNKIEKAI